MYELNSITTNLNEVDILIYYHSTLDLVRYSIQIMIGYPTDFIIIALCINQYQIPFY